MDLLHDQKEEEEGEQEQHHSQQDEEENEGQKTIFLQKFNNLKS